MKAGNLSTRSFPNMIKIIQKRITHKGMKHTSINKQVRVLTIHLTLKLII